MYKGQEPFSVFCKQQFSLDRRMGSTDRKWVRHYCYCFFRMGNALRALPIEERMVTGLFLCGKKEDPLLALLRPAWNQRITSSLTEKLAFLSEALPGLVQAIFPYEDLLSKPLAGTNWPLSLLEQPLLFIRLRPGKEQQVIEALQAQSILFEQVGERSLALPATTSLSSWPGLNRDFVIQDLSSQRIGSMLSALPASATKKIWDCCAASGGKSILTIDTLGAVSLTVSDKRKTILQQLHRRFVQAEITDYSAIEIDLTQPVPSSFSDTFSLIWADVPCSGSGTWSRTPEQLYFFQDASLNGFTKLQRDILQTALSRLQPGGYLLYSTCSVFAQENEEQVAWLEKESGLRCIQQQLFDGSAQQADTLFAALLQRSR
ncbi:MAG: Fmu (Sun) domain protein [Chitinophagia bacterium]|nr:Fmu (Sun) domain protein [Chitinophagia bacterium]